MDLILNVCIILFLISIGVAGWYFGIDLHRYPSLDNPSREYLIRRDQFYIKVFMYLMFYNCTVMILGSLTALALLAIGY